ncbi:MAG: hypothetical protein VYE07_00970, partial [Actinomycetota bacterium]|nr:hypothetical protein [Actinomycetota bacterium]
MEFQDTTAPTGLARILGGLIQHSETWGKIWFGLVFWGSVLFAISTRIWPDTNDMVLLAASLIIGLTAGIY